MPRPETEPIASLDNPQVRLAHSLLEATGRRRHGAFLVEGMRLVESAVALSTPLLVFHLTSFGQTDGRERSLLRHLRGAGIPVRPVTERVLSHITDTVTPQGVVAAMSLPDTAEPGSHPVPGATLVLVLDAVSDPGNAGTLLRSAAGAGAAAVVAMRGTVDLYSPKVVRAGAGAHFQLAIATGVRWDALEEWLPVDGQVLQADAAATTPYWEVNWSRPSALIVSSEAHGASEAAREWATQGIAIPLREIGSLNVGVAGSIMMFEAARQRAEAK